MSYQYQYSDRIGLPWVLEHMPQFLFPDLGKKKDRIQKLFDGVIATLDRSPVGLILSTRDDAGRSARIHSMLVHPHHRHRGIGGQLMQHLQDALVAAGIEKIDGYYRSHWQHASTIEKLLARQGWSDPVEDLIIVRGKAEKVLKLFTDRELDFPPEYSCVSFDQITPTDREQIRRRGAEGGYLDYLDPFIHEATIYAPASLFLRHEDQIIGWVISHLIAPDLNEFTALFVDANHRPYKLAHLLMRKAIYNQHEDGIVNFLITSKTDNYVMSRFLLRHAPATQVFLTRSLHSEKQILPE